MSLKLHFFAISVQGTTTKYVETLEICSMHFLLSFILFW